MPAAVLTAANYSAVLCGDREHRMAEGKRDDVTLKLTRVEALALVNAAETGLRVIEALGLVKNTGTMEAAVRKLRAAT